jgi:hypothetical protein
MRFHAERRVITSFPYDTEIDEFWDLWGAAKNDGIFDRNKDHRLV